MRAPRAAARGRNSGPSVKGILEHINKIFENRIRLGVMSILMVNDATEFTVLREMLDLTDGNLASHMATLEKSLYITVHKRFLDKKPVTTYAATAKGRQAFTEHLNALEQIIRKTQ